MRYVWRNSFHLNGYINKYMFYEDFFFVIRKKKNDIKHLRPKRGFNQNKRRSFFYESRIAMEIGFVCCV